LQCLRRSLRMSLSCRSCQSRRRIKSHRSTLCPQSKVPLDILTKPASQRPSNEATSNSRRWKTGYTGSRNPEGVHKWTLRKAPRRSQRKRGHSAGRRAIPGPNAKMANFFSARKRCRNSILEIEQMFAKAGLEFLGLQVPYAPGLTRFREEHPAQSDLTSLVAWHQFEERHPQVFGGTYQLWARKQPWLVAANWEAWPACDSVSGKLANEGQRPLLALSGRAACFASCPLLQNGQQKVCMIEGEEVSLISRIRSSQEPDEVEPPWVNRLWQGRHRKLRAGAVLQPSVGLRTTSHLGESVRAAPWI